MTKLPLNRFAVVRVPNTGRKALIAEPNVFRTQSGAEARIAEIEGGQHRPHHTHLEVFRLSGEMIAVLQATGIDF